MEYFNSGLLKSRRLLRFFVYIYGFLALYYWIIKLPAGSGDEGLMARYLEDAKTLGFFNYLGSSNLSAPHFLLLYLPSQFISPFMMLRIVSLLFSILIYMYMKNKFHNKYPEYKYHLLFYLFSGSFFLGTNDTMMIFFLTVFFVDYYRVIEGLDDQLPIYSLASLIIALFTREMAIIYLPVVFIALGFLSNNKYYPKKAIFLAFGTLVFLLILNLPSLNNNGKISFDNKVQEKQLGVTWDQLKYLSQIYANEGKIPENQYLSWVEVREYLDLNGENSLPKSTFKAIFFDLNLTIKESVKDFIYIGFSGIRQIGFAIFSPFVLFGAMLFKKDLSKASFFLASMVLSMAIIFSIIIIAYIEIRWLAPAFLVGIVGWYVAFEKLLTRQFYRLINVYLIILLSLYGSFTYLIRIFS
jgi:hypothetical protein